MRQIQVPQGTSRSAHMMGIIPSVCSCELLISQTSHGWTPFGPHPSVHLREVLAHGRLKMQLMYVTMTECLLRGGVHFPHGRLKVQCLYAAGTSTESLPRTGIHLCKIKNAVFVCGWDLD